MAVINGTNGNNTLAGTSGDDTINGFGGNDTLKGGGGDDMLTGGAGDDTMDGGENSDTYLVGPGDGFDRYGDTGTTGLDRIRATADNTVIGIKSNFSAANGIEQIDGDGRSNVIIRAGGTNNTLDFSQVVLTSIALIDGGAGSDTVLDRPETTRLPAVWGTTTWTAATARTPICIRPVTARTPIRIRVRAVTTASW